jgi:hypothetical protein
MITPPKKPTAQQAGSLLKSNQGALAPLLEKVNKLQQLNASFLPLIEPGLKSHCQVVNYTEHHLVMAVPNGALATQLHFMIPTLLVRCKQDPHLRHIQTIQCKVQPGLFPKPRITE